MREEAATRSCPNPWLVVSGATLALVLAYLAVFAVPPLITVFVDDLGLSHAEAGALMSVSIGAIAISSLFSGALAGRFGPRRLMVAGLVFCCASLLAFGVTTNLGVLLACRVGVGLGVGLLYAPGLALVAAVLPPRQVNGGIGIYLSGIPVGATVAFVSARPLENALDWRWPSRLFGLAGLVGAVGVGLLVRSARQRLAIGSGGRTGGTLRALGRNGAFRLACAALFVSIFVTYGVVTWIPPYLDESAGFSANQVSLASMILMAGGIPASLVGGWAADRTGRPLAVAAAGMAGVLPVAFLAASASPSFATATLVGVAASFGVSVALVPLYALPAVIVGPAAAATGAAIASSAALLGGIVSTYAGGWLIGRTDGYGVAFWIYAVAAAVTAIVLTPALARSLRRAAAR